MWKILASAVVSLALLASGANAQGFTRQEIISFESATAPTNEFLLGKKGDPVTIAGNLRLPKATEKNPVVILFHGAGGVGGEGAPPNDWARVLNEAGIATFTVDSFAGRGIATLADSSKISPVSRTIDAYRALELLSKHPLIDANKIAVMGFSHGGATSLYSSLVRFQKMYQNPDVHFAAHISVYGPCWTTYREDEVLDKSPVLMLHGIVDNWVPIGPCREYSARLAQAGVNVQMNEYPESYHVFDGPALKQPVQLPQATTSRNCRYTEGEAGSIINVATKQPSSPSDSCLEKGVTIQYNEAAANKAHDDVKLFLKNVFAQNRT